MAGLLASARSRAAGQTHDSTAVAGTQRVRARCDAQPETFCFTDADFALEICQAVREAWQISAERPLILNLPATVEVATPNVHADQLEGFIRGLGLAP